MVNRGEIWWASLPAPVKSEPGFERPLVIIQSDAFNESNISTAICAVITSNLKLADAPGNFMIPARSSGLNKDSIVNVSQIITVDKSFLEEKAGRLTGKQMMRLDEGLKLVLAME